MLLIFYVVNIHVTNIRESIRLVQVSTYQLVPTTATHYGSQEFMVNIDRMIASVSARSWDDSS